MRRDFILPEEDMGFLQGCGFKWDNITESRNNWLIIYDYPVPTGYNVSKVNVALRIDSGYPVSQIDMAFFNPVLTLVSGRTIPAANVMQPVNGASYQRWSRHRTGQNPWRPGVDSIATHLQLVTYWFERELKK